MGDFMKAKDLREQTEEELANFLSDKQRELFKLRFQHFTGQLENTAKMRLVRREVARARTIIAQRQKAPMEQSAPTEQNSETEQKGAES